MDAIQKLRIRLWLKSLVWICPLCILAFYFFVNIKYSAGFLVCFLLTCFLLLVPVSIYGEELNRQIIKNEILPNLRRNFSKSISYRRDSNNYKPTIEPINKAFGEYLHGWGDICNVLTGSINGVNYKIADARVKSGFWGGSYTTFFGQVIELESVKENFAKIIVRPKKLYSHFTQDGLSLNKDFVLNKHIVYTNDSTKGDDRIFLLIKNFVESYNKKMYVKMVDNKILIMIDSNVSLLEQFNLFNIRKYDYKKIYMILDLIKHISEHTLL